MSNETYVTVRGYVGSVPTIFGSDPQRSTVVMRVGVTARRFNREVQEFTNGETAWYSVRCYGTLGQHVVRSVHRGTPVLVRGRLVPRMWADKDGVQHTEFNILADAVGIELSTGVAHFIHARLTEPPALEGEHRETAQQNAAEGTPAPEETVTNGRAMTSGFQPEGGFSISGSFERDPDAAEQWESRDPGAVVDPENPGAEELEETAEEDLLEDLDPAGNLAHVYS